MAYGRSKKNFGPNVRYCFLRYIFALSFWSSIYASYMYHICIIYVSYLSYAHSTTLEQLLPYVTRDMPNADTNLAPSVEEEAEDLPSLKVYKV